MARPKKDKEITIKKEVATLTPKQIATERNEPWVTVIDTKFNPENPRNGFFELDWNRLFIDLLIQHGFGLPDDPEEEIIDRWFRELAYNVLLESDNHHEVRVGGYINVQKLTNNHLEIK